MELNALVVEDNASSMELICEALHGAGISAMGTRSPVHASDLLDRRKFDGIFLDLAMPGLNGAALSRQIRRSTRNASTPIIVVGEQNRPGPNAIKEAFAAGAQFYLAKPLDRTKLVRLVNSTQGSLMRERLRNQTVEVRTAVSCRTGSGEYSGVSAQVNETGIVFQFDGKLHSGDFVRLSFRLPRTECKVETTGTIVRVMRDAGKQRAACRFDNLNSASLQAIHDFVTSSAVGADNVPTWGRNQMPAAESLTM
jgi:CheY-like chemotaxis protein